jgi:hypothetical protein
MYSKVSAEAKLLYGLLLDRVGLSVNNGWRDENGSVFIYFTLEDVSECLKCGHDKATRLFSELEKADLIYRKKQGLGKAARIFVKKFISDCGKLDVQNAGKPHSGKRKSRSFECVFSAGNNIETNNTEMNDTDLNNNNLSICDDMDAIVKEQIDYDTLAKILPNEKNKIDEIVCLITDTLSATTSTIKISGNEFPAEVVRSRFRKLTYEHIEYVINNCRNNTSSVINIRSYLLAALYNAPTTMESYYTALVNHDLYGQHAG